MNRQTATHNRHLAILHSIVQTYIETGEPVASRTVARRLREDWSPATIRNVMADLFEEGYLAQPHTSAGRIPTEKAFQSYVRTLSGRRLTNEEVLRLRSVLNQTETVQGYVQMSTHLLMEMTRGFCIAAAVPTSSQALDQIDLLALADRRVLIVLVMRDRMVRNRVVALQEAISQDELH